MVVSACVGISVNYTTAGAFPAYPRQDTFSLRVHFLLKHDVYLKSVTIPFRQEDHVYFDAEWPIQRKVSGWWFFTRYFSEKSKPE